MKVSIVIPGVEVDNAARIGSPRVARREQASDFVLEVVAAETDTGMRSDVA